MWCDVGTSILVRSVTRRLAVTELIIRPLVDEFLVWHSDVHPVNGRDAENRSVGSTDKEGSLGNVAHLPVVNGECEAEAASIDSAGVEAVHDGEARHLPVSARLYEHLIGALRVEWHALGDVALVEVVALGPAETVHFL